ncbi:MAG: lysophospholipid acyltransferase family protein [Syntrophobacteraceae bacterium]
MQRARSLFIYVFLFFSTVYCGIAAIIVFLLTRRNDWSHRIGSLWGMANLRVAGTRVQVEGLDKIAPGQSYVFAANHQSWFDIFAIYACIPVQFRWLAKEELFHVPVLGPAMKACGAIPIDRGDRRKAFESINQAAAKVRAGTSIVIFPEGTRSVDGVLQGFKTGGFILAIKSQQPMLPISISGSHRILPKRREWMIQRGTILMTLGNPIPTSGLTNRDRDTLMAAVRDAIRKYLPESEGGVLPDPPAADSFLSSPEEGANHAV